MYVLYAKIRGHLNVTLSNKFVYFNTITNCCCMLHFDKFNLAEMTAENVITHLDSPRDG